MEGLEKLDEVKGIVLLRCATCREGFDTNLSSGIYCSFCHGQQWTNQIGHMTVRQRIKVYRLTGSWFQQDPPDKFDKVVVAMEPLITALGG